MGTLYPVNNMQAETFGLHTDGAGFSMPSTEEVMERPWVSYDLDSREYDGGGDKHMFVFSLRSAPKTSPQNPRPGMESDEWKLRQCFQNLGFTVHQPYYDFTLQDLYVALNRMSNMNHRYTSCVAVVFLTYGDKGGGTMDAFDKSFLLDDVVNFVQHAPALAGKPKLFFNQACSRGNQDPGLRVFSSNRSAVTVPTHSDCYAVTSYEDEATLRSSQGSPWVEALRDVMDNHHQEFDFVHLMSLLNLRVDMKSSHYTMNKFLYL